MYSTKGKRLNNLKDIKRDTLYILVNPNTPFFIQKPYKEFFSNYLYFTKQNRNNRPVSRNVSYSRASFRTKLQLKQYSPMIREVGIDERNSDSSIVLKYPKETQTSDHQGSDHTNSRESVRSRGSRTSNQKSEAEGIPVNIL